MSEDSPLEWREFSNWIVAGIVLFVLGAYAQRYLGGGPGGGGSELVGKKAPPVQVEDVQEGEMVDLADYREQVVLLDFWATWCTVCKRQMPRLKEAVERANLGDELSVLLVNTQESGTNRGTKVRRYLAKHGLEFRTALDDGSVMQRYGIQGLPTMVIVGRSGHVDYVGKGLHPTDEIVAQIEEAAGGDS